MDTHVITTSFGRRPVTLGAIAAGLQVRQAIADAQRPGSNAPAAVNKWQVSRTLSEIRARIGVSDRALSVLSALLSFHPETALSLPKPRATGAGGERGDPTADPALDAACDVNAPDGGSPSCELIVFPSNKALGQRAHGMAPATLWRHLTALVQAGLIIRRDSPNGKRYARKGAGGQAGDGERFSDAFGFDLTPLVTRAPEFDAIAMELRADARRRDVNRERISLLRRDVTKLIALGLDERLPGDWEGLRARAMTLMTPLRRLRDDQTLDALAAALADLRAEVANMLENHVNRPNMQGNDTRHEAHQSNIKTEYLTDFEPASKEEGSSMVPPDAGISDDTGTGQAGETTSIGSAPLGLVMEACPDVHDYAAGGRVRDWAGFLDAAGAIRPMIGISPDAWREAMAVLGRVEAHIVVATILQRSIHSSEAETGPGASAGTIAVTVNGSPAIQSAGGYLRALTDKARIGSFALGPVLMALIGQRLKRRRAKSAGTTVATMAHASVTERCVKGWR